MDGPVKPAPADISDGGSPPPAKRCGACNKPLENDRRDYCDDCCKRDAAYTRERLLRGTKTPRKRQLRAGIREGVRNGPKNPTETITCKRPPSVDLGAFVRQQILAQQDQPNPIHFTTPDGVRGKVWLASKRNKNGSYSKIVGDERHWRVHIPEAAKVDEDARRALAAKAPLADIWQTELQPRRLSGLRCRLCIEAEKELQVLGCGWRIVTCQLRGTDVLLHHNGNTAKLKRGAFKRLVAATKDSKEPTTLS